MIPKFRAWDKLTKTMISVEAISYTEEVIYPFNGKVIKRFVPFKDIVLMQSTGLKDKNSAEIFERDIVRQVFSQPKSAGKGLIFEVVGVVKMLQGAWYIVDEKNAQMSSLWSEADENEVIGNFYENPELLEE